MALQAATKSLILLGKCLPSMKQGVSRFKVKRLELDTNLNMYFAKHEEILAHDPENKCKSGDVVLLELLRTQTTREVTHNVKEIIYPMGDITDPITGKKVVSGKYREHVEKVNEVYGKRDKSFDYDKAPPRGWQEGKKDITHVQTYIKYHEDGTPQPHSV